jgi:DNA polymerase-3 subunit epsilon
MSTFAAIDFETATASRNSACSVGVVIVDDGLVVEKQSRLIKPPDNLYDSLNISIHGIAPEDTKNAQSFEEVWPEMSALIGDRLVVAHNAAFDVSVLRKSSIEKSYTPPPFRFVCSYRMAKGTWNDRWSYKLNDLANDLGIELDHHDALSDANAAGQVLLAILSHHGNPNVEEVADLLGYRIGEVHADEYQGFSNATCGGSHRLSELTAEGSHFDAEHPLYDRKVAFTGALETMTRAEAAQKAINVGASVTNSVGAKLDFLVVGETDLDRVGSDGMSSKLRKAVNLAESGTPLEIIGENDFLMLVSL